jgi:hypothetical protein
MTPICLFVYNKVTETKRTIEYLKNNIGSEFFDLYVFSDGWKNDDVKNQVVEVREYIRNIDGFKSITVFESEENKGLAKSIISGVTQVINIHDSVIVVEDDLITSTNFLLFMHNALQHYRDENIVFSISGYVPKVSDTQNYDAFLWGRPHSWGWATWKDRWDNIDWQLDCWCEVKLKEPKMISKYGSDLIPMMDKSVSKKINSWYIRFCINQILMGKFTIYPSLSKVVNIGFTEIATHCDTYNREVIDFDKSEKVEFSFPENMSILAENHKEMYRTRSIFYRICNRLLTLMLKFGIINQREAKY